MDAQDHFAERVVAMCASVVVLVFLVVAWIVVSVSVWLLAYRPGTIPEADPLIGPLALLLAGGVGTLLAAGVLLSLARSWTRWAADNASTVVASGAELIEVPAA